MRANFWSQCRVCDEPIHGPGTSSSRCPCGVEHRHGELQALVEVPGHGRRWVHGDCADQLEHQTTEQQHEITDESEHGTGEHEAVPGDREHDQQLEDEEIEP